MHEVYIYDTEKKEWIEQSHYMIRQLIQELRKTRDIRDKATISLLKGIGLNLLYIRKNLEWIINAIQEIAEKQNITLPKPPEQTSSSTASQ